MLHDTAWAILLVCCALFVMTEGGVAPPPFPSRGTVPHVSARIGAVVDNPRYAPPSEDRSGRRTSDRAIGRSAASSKALFWARVQDAYADGLRR